MKMSGVYRDTTPGEQAIMGQYLPGTGTLRNGYRDDG